MQKQNQEQTYFLQYLFLAPVLGILTISIALSTWIIFNYFFPDLLFHPMP